MLEVAPDVFLLRQFPPYAINVYVLEGHLIDAGTRFDRRRILRQTRRLSLHAHVLTHAHPDHQGATRALCERKRIPLWCGANDVEAAENPKRMIELLPHRWFNKLVGPLWAGPGRHVDRPLREGDRVGRFQVLETPGHTAGHISLWREHDRLLLVGDVVAHMNWKRWRPELREPPAYFSADPALNRASAHRLAALRPARLLFGHGPPLDDPALFQRFVHERLLLDRDPRPLSTHA